MHRLLAPMMFAWALSAALVLVPESARADAGSASLVAAKGDVKTRGPKDKSYTAVAVGASIPAGNRLRTGDDGEATIKFADGTESKLRPKTEIVVHAEKKAEEASSVSLFFGRIWTKAAKASGADESFEVRAANATAGVRGTQFEVGVADDGSARVIVSEGAVGVAGDDEKPVNVSSGFEIETDNGGKLADKKKAGGDPDWEGWFSKRARELEKNGLKVAKGLDGRLNQRKAKVEKLVAEQKTLRQRIEKLEQDKKNGGDVDAELQSTLEKLERTTARLEDMRDRLEGSFGLFEKWGQIARGGGMGDGGDQVSKMSDDIARIAADFADMIEEGTDMSEEGMDDMMNEMRDVKGGAKKNKPKKNAGDELF